MMGNALLREGRRAAVPNQMLGLVHLLEMGPTKANPESQPSPTGLPEE